MQILVAKNGEKIGPFDRDEIYRRLVGGELHGTDLGWHEGLAEWEPLMKLVPPPTAAQAGLPPALVPAAIGSPQSTSKLAVASLLCGVMGFFTIALTSFPAVIMGHMALSRIKKSLGAVGGKDMAVAGLIMGYLLFSIAILASLVLPTLNIIPEAGNRSKTLNNARQLVIAMRVYAADHDGKLPPTLDTLFDEGIVEDRSLLKVLGTDPAKGGWEYLGTGMKDSANGSAAVIISREVYRDGKRVVGLLDGSVCVEKSSLE